MSSVCLKRYCFQFSPALTDCTNIGLKAKPARKCNRSDPGPDSGTYNILFECTLRDSMSLKLKQKPNERRQNQKHFSFSHIRIIYEASADEDLWLMQRTEALHTSQTPPLTPFFRWELLNGCIVGWQYL